MNQHPDGALLSARELSCEIGGRQLWRNLSFTLRPGERLAVSGPSGTGKTVLLRTLAGLTALASGEIRFRNRLLETWPMPEYRSQVVYLPQRPALPEGSVETALRAPFRLRVHRRRRYSAAAVDEYLAALGLNERFLTQSTESLSGGEGQIAAALRALLIEPSVLLLDEPTASLDANTARRIETLIEHWLEQDKQRGYLWTSHDRSQLDRISDRTMNLHKLA